jgi:hypothetical protein
MDVEWGGGAVRGTTLLRRSRSYRGQNWGPDLGGSDSTGTVCAAYSSVLRPQVFSGREQVEHSNPHASWQDSSVVCQPYSPEEKPGPALPLQLQQAAALLATSQ